MKNLITLLLISLLSTGMVSCSDDDADEPLVECPAPSYLMGLITQVEAIRKEVPQMEAQVGTAQGADREALVNNINKAKEREKVLLDELEDYRHCL